jgi:hypothetical protein
MFSFSDVDEVIFQKLHDFRGCNLDESFKEADFSSVKEKKILVFRVIPEKKWGCSVWK